MRQVTLLIIALLYVQPAKGTEISIKNFREIFESLAVATGVTPTATHLNAFAQLRDVLPKFGEVEEVTPSMTLAVFKLSGHFCRSLISADAIKIPEQRLAHKDINFTKVPKDIPQASRESVIHAYAGLFWQATPSAAEVTRMLTLMDELTATVPVSTTGTQSMLQMSCSAMASAIEFLMI